MIADQASRTAQGAAMHRAAHQLLDRPLVFEDPLALRIIGTAAEAELRAGNTRYLQPRMARLRAFLAVRSRFAEDCLSASGAGQYVLLGAGLDTFAYRANLMRLKVFEVDHPATQAWKRQRLKDAAIAVPQGVVFVPVDFEREQFSEALGDVGFDFGAPAVVGWLGVVPYLEKPTVIDTLKRISAAMARGTQIIFDYPSPPEEMTEEERRLAAAFALRVAAAGEPLRCFFAPHELHEELSRAGYSRVEDLDHATLTARHLAGRTDGLALSRYAHILRASI